MRGRCAYTEVDAPGFDEPLAAGTKERELLRREAEGDALARARGQLDALEAAQLEHRPRHARDRVADIELHHLVARHAARVLHGDRQVDAFARTHRRGALCEVAVAKLAVRQAMAKGELRGDG